MSWFRSLFASRPKASSASDSSQLRRDDAGRVKPTPSSTNASPSAELREARPQMRHETLDQLSAQLEKLPEPTDQSRRFFVLKAKVGGGAIAAFASKVLPNVNGGDFMRVMQCTEMRKLIEQSASGLGKDHEAVTILRRILALLESSAGGPAAVEDAVNAEEHAMPERVLQFPNDRSLGKLEIAALYGSGAAEREARGAVSVGAGQSVRLIVSRAGCLDLAALAHLSSNAIQRIDLKGVPEGVELGRWSVADGQLVHLRGLTELRALSLWMAGDVTDQGVAHIVSIAGLTFLDLGRTKVTDKGLSRICGLERLSWLGLSDTAVTDASIDVILNFVKLQQLFVKGTQISAAGFERLKSGLPHCKVSRD